MARHGENIRKRKDGRWEGRYLAYSEEKEKWLYRSVYGRAYEEAREKLHFWKNSLKESAAGRIEMMTAEDVREKSGVESKAEISGTDGNEGKGNGRGSYCGESDYRESDYRESDGREHGGEGNSNGGSGKENPENKCASIEIYFWAVAEEWLAKVRFARKTSTYIKYWLIYKNYLEKHFRNMEISLVTDRTVQEKIPASLSESIGKSVYCVLNQIIKYASEKYALRLMPLKRQIPYMPKRTVETFSRKEQSELFAVLYQERDVFKTAILLCLYTGLRLGELCALKWEDIDMENQLIAVRRTVQRLYVEGHMTKTVLLETAPKSASSRREIPLPSAVFALLKALQEENKKEYVFGGDKPVEPRTMQNHFKRILKKAGLSDKNFHALRHTFSTNCIEGGTDVKSLSELLGHSDVQITLNRYVHPSMDTKRRHLDALAGFYERMCGQGGGMCNGMCG